MSDAENDRILRFSELPAAPARKLSKQCSTFYYRPGSRDYLHAYPDGRAVPVTEASVRSALVIEAVIPDKRSADSYLYDVRQNWVLQYDGSMPGYSIGLHEENGQLCYCTAAPKLIEDISGEGEGALGERWPVIYELLQRLLRDESSGDHQLLTFLAALKSSVRALREALDSNNKGAGRSVRPGQAIALVGPRACGKTFVFEQIIAPLLGGRVVDAFKAFSADAHGFNGELLAGEVWKVDDRECSTDARVRRQFAANLKAYLFSANVSFHPKYRTPLTMVPFARLFIMCNDTVENLRVLPEIGQDIEDKIHLFRCNPTEPPMPTFTDEERQRYRETVRSELPWMAGNLEEWIVPERYREGRSGVATYMHPELLRGLRRQDPDAMLAELVQVAFEEGLLNGNPWRGTAAQLRGILTHKDAPNSRQANELLSWPRATGTYLGRMADKARFFEAEYCVRVRRRGQSRGIEEYEIALIESQIQGRLI